MADVFISYHDKTNGTRAEEIAATLESAGITCWYARRDVSTGGDFTHEVITQIEDCKIFLLLLDNGAARSLNVKTEVGNAFGRRKKIMPYQTDKKDVKGIPWVQYYLQQIQIVSLPDYDTLTKEIASALGRPVQMVNQTTQTTVEPESENIGLDTRAIIIGFELFYVILFTILGFWAGPYASFNWLQIPLDDFFKSILGAFVGYYIGFIVGGVMNRHIPNGISRLYALQIYALLHTLEIYILVIWLIIGAILGIILGYMQIGILGLMIAFLCMGLAVSVMRLIFYIFTL